MADARIRPIAVMLLAVFGLLACDSSDHQSDGDRFNLATPDRIRNIEAINPAALTAVAMVNGVEVVLNPAADGTFSGDVVVPANSVVPVNIQFTEQVNGQSLVLATRSQQVTTGNSDNRLTLRRSAYNFEAHDADGDSVSNIIEREQDTDPLDANDAPPMVTVNVVAARPEDINNTSDNNYTVEAAIGSSVRLLQRSGNQFQGVFFVADRSPVTVSADFIERVTGQQLAVASQSYELSEIFDQQTITFSDTGYTLTDRDGDSESDLAEIIAGTSIFESGSGGGTASGNFTFTTTFDIPSVITNAGSIYAEFRVDGQLMDSGRNANTYTAGSTVGAGAIVVLDVLLQDNFNGNAYTVAQAQKTVPIASDQQLVQFSEAEFNLQFDADQDGVLNYIEREQATNPFIANTDPVGGGVSCTVSAIPTQLVAAGATGMQSMDAFINCGGAAYELAASDFQFSWNSTDNSIQWVVPASAAPDSQFAFTVAVRNPTNASEVYTSFQVNTTVASAIGGCNAVPSTIDYVVDRDLHVQGSEVFNEVQLRVDGINRQTLLGFPVPANAMLTGNATLSITVGNDQGDGVIEVSQPDSFQWSESDAELLLPQAVSLGSLSTNWQSGQQYQFDLTGLSQKATGEISLILTQLNGNDVAFLARESGTSAVLSVEVAADCSKP